MLSVFIYFVNIGSADLLDIEVGSILPDSIGLLGPDFNLNTWTINHMKYSGLGEKDCVTLYKRDEAVRLWSELCGLKGKARPDGKKDILFVAALVPTC